MFGGMHAVIARNRRDEREAVEPVAVDLYFAKRRQNSVGLWRNETVLDPRTMARRKDDNASELRAAHRAHRGPCRFSGIRPASMRQNEDIRLLARLRLAACSLPLLGESADFAFSSGIPRSRYRASKRHGVTPSLYAVIIPCLRRLVIQRVARNRLRIWSVKMTRKSAAIENSMPFVHPRRRSGSTTWPRTTTTIAPTVTPTTQ